MIYIQIEPHQAEDFQKLMQQNDWQLISQDGGQSHFIGWAYIMQWQKKVEELDAKVWLHYSENQGVKASHLEMNPAAKEAMAILLKSL